MAMLLVWLFVWHLFLTDATEQLRFEQVRSKTSANEQTQAVYSLIERILPHHTHNFAVVIDPTLQSRDLKDAFQFVTTDDGKLTITANSGVSASAGFYHYLKYWCNTHISWSGDQLNIPKPMPIVDQPVKIAFQGRFRYYQNVCTVSYSMAFWGWKRWQREIDWMAMNGVNLPLAFTAQEAVWKQVYTELGLTQDELDRHFAGPAFLAWQRMGNLDGWGGPLPRSWYKRRLELQHKILKRMRSLGMTPVLPGFAGHVPKALVTRVYPHALHYTLDPWVGFYGRYGNTVLLDPQDPLFKKIGGMFISRQIELYNGTDHVYNADLFNEMNPPHLTTQFMTNTSRGVYEAMLAGDPKAVWLMQGWLFLNKAWKPDLMRAWFSAVPLGRLLLLDLASELYPIYEETDGYYGHPFIWCMIENFGGTTRLYGKLHDLMNGVLKARKKYPSLMMGTGMTPEGINQNEVNFELMWEMGWREEGVALDEWMTRYTHRRYGFNNALVQKASLILLHSIYNCTDSHENGGWVGRVPVMRPLLSDALPVNMWYAPSRLYEAWTMMVEASKTLPHSETFRHDFVKVGTQVQEDMLLTFYKQLVVAYRQNSTTGVKLHSFQLLHHLQNMDNLLRTDPHSLLGAWIQYARQWGETIEEKNLMEYNARNQVTLWGPQGQISDYANKNWAGLVSSYYLPRWRMFVQELQVCLKAHVAFNEKAFRKNLLVFEQSWNRKGELASVASGDAYTIAQRLYIEYETHFFSSPESRTLLDEAFRSKQYKGSRFWFF